MVYMATHFLFVLCISFSMLFHLLLLLTLTSFYFFVVDVLQSGLGVMQILWSIHLWVGLFQTLSIVEVQGSFHHADIQIWLAEVVSMHSFKDWRSNHAYLTEISVSNDTRISSIESVLDGIKWGHSLARIVECPTSHPLVKSSSEGTRSKLARPVQPKGPLSVDTVGRIADHYISSSSLAVIRFLGWLCWILPYGRNSQFLL